jgi:hypothetical protein
MTLYRMGKSSLNPVSSLAGLVERKLAPQFYWLCKFSANTVTNFFCADLKQLLLAIN